MLAEEILPSSVMLAVKATESLKVGALGILLILEIFGMRLQKLPPGQTIHAYSG